MKKKKRVINIEVRKQNWKKARSALPTFIGKVTEHGNSANVDPTLPREYLGKTVLITVIEDDEVLSEILLKNTERGENERV